MPTTKELIIDALKKPTVLAIGHAKLWETVMRILHYEGYTWDNGDLLFFDDRYSASALLCPTPDKTLIMYDEEDIVAESITVIDNDPLDDIPEYVIKYVKQCKERGETIDSTLNVVRITREPQGRSVGVWLDAEDVNTYLLIELWETDQDSEVQHV